MKMLVLGGTVFLGRHLVEAALAHGHELTLFTRGQHNPDLYPQVERLRGDRDGGLDALVGRRWDVAIDTCGYVPRIVRASATLLADAVDHYTFISTLSVYADLSRIGIDEHSPVGTLADPATEEITGETYGPLKALCEQAAEAALPGRTLVIRPGLIVGPHDPTDRFTYWPVRVAQGGEVLAPGRPANPIQVIDARDLAEWTLRMVAERRTGIYNADSPDSLLTMGALLDSCREVSGSDARFTWVDDEALLAAGATPWSEVPVWVPEREGPGFFRVSCAKATVAGLTFRPIAETVRDTLAWHATRPAAPLKAGMSREREADLLRAAAQTA